MINNKQEKDYWNTRYAQGGNSGAGSYGLTGKKKLDHLAKLDFSSVSELGCGDFNFGNNLLDLHPASYIGLDVSEVAVIKNSQQYPQHTFGVVGTDYSLPQGDLLLCVDVLFHIIEDSEYERVLSALEKTWTKYLALTAYERDEEFSNHVRIRKFDYKRFGEPIVREIVEENGSLYFYIFKK